MAMGKAEEVVEVIDSKGCSTLFSSASTSRSSPSSQITESSMSPSSSSSYSGVRANGPFASLVICVTGLSKEARKQVSDATERLGGQYSPSLHPQCTHLVVQSFHGRKFEHALKHGPRNGLFVVNLGWFVDSIRKNVRLNESLYSVKRVVEGGLRVELNHLVRISDTEKSCAPVGLHEDTREPSTRELENPPSGEKSGTSRNLVLSGHSIYLDPDISDDVKTTVVDAASKGGIVIINSWFAGCGAAHVVCEGHSTWKYFGHTDSIVTPQWILKTIRENYVQRLVHMSADLARQVSGIVENYQNGIGLPEQRSMEHPACIESRPTLEERQQIVDKAKSGVRGRRRHTQARKAQIRPITPSTLMDSICWSISDPTSAACVYTDTSEFEDHSESTSLPADHTRVSEASFENLCRPLSESEKSEKILKNHFMTILFPVDRFGEMGPCSRTFFSENGFTCLQLLDYIYKFYQENMSEDEVNMGIYTDSKHADRLRSCYTSSKECEFKRIDFMGTRRSFEMLKRVCGDSSSNVYELLIRA